MTGDDNTSMSENSISALLQKLQQLYTEKSFQEGVDLLIESKSQFNQAQFHELLGSFHMKLDHYAAARYHFEMALSKGASGQTIHHNLEYVLGKLGIMSHYSMNFFERSYETVSLLPFEFWAAISLLFLAIAIWNLRFKWKHGSRFLVITLWLAALIPQGLYWGHFQPQVAAIVLSETPLYEGPSAVFSSPKTIRAGEKIIIDKNKDGWSLIVSPKFLSGWVENQNLGFLGRL